MLQTYTTANCKDTNIIRFGEKKSFFIHKRLTHMSLLPPPGAAVQGCATGNTNHPGCWPHWPLSVPWPLLSRPCPDRSSTFIPHLLCSCSSTMDKVSNNWRLTMGKRWELGRLWSGPVSVGLGRGMPLGSPPHAPAGGGGTRGVFPSAGLVRMLAARSLFCPRGRWGFTLSFIISFTFCVCLKKN